MAFRPRPSAKVANVGHHANGWEPEGLSEHERQLTRNPPTNQPVLVPRCRLEEGLRALFEVPPALALLPPHPLGLDVIGHAARVWRPARSEKGGKPFFL